MPSREAAAAQDRGFERELRRQARCAPAARSAARRSCSRGSRKRRRCGRSMRSARADSVKILAPSGISSSPRISPCTAASCGAPLALPADEPARDAQEARPPERLRLRDNPADGAKLCSPSAISSLLRIGRQPGGELLGEIADRLVDHAAAVGGAGRRVDRFERMQIEHVLGVDGVGIAQPVLDLGDRQARRAAPRAAASARAARPVAACRRARRAPRAQREIMVAALARLVPALRAGERRDPLQEARGDRRRAADSWPARVSTTSLAPSACAKSCAARPMRRSGRSRPSSSRIGRLTARDRCASRGGQLAFVEAAEHHAVDVCRRASSGPKMRMRTPARSRMRTTRAASAAWNNSG